MTRLADLILNSPAHAPLLAAPPDPTAIPVAGDVAGYHPVVVADAVSEYFFVGTPREYWRFDRDFPDCTPPFPAVFVELARPSRVVSGTRGLNGAAFLPPRWGWRFESTSRDQLEAILRDGARGPALEGHYRSYVDALSGSGRVDVAAVTEALDAPDPLEAAGRLGGPDGGYFAAASIVRALGGLKGGDGHRGRGGIGWLLHGALVLGRDGLAVGPVATLDVILDGAGRPAPPPLIDIFGGAGLNPVETAVLRAIILPLAFPAFMALSFLNTGGTLRAAEPSPEVARRHEGQGSPAPVCYQVLDIGAVAGVERN